MGLKPVRSVPIRIAFASTYPPRRCGIATYTSDLGRASGNREIVALTPPDHEAPYPTEVHHRIRRDIPDDYVRVARALDGCRVDVVSIQHDFAIWGGPDGEYVLDFVRALNRPAVTTLHAIGRRPSAAQRRIVSELIEATSATVVMSQAAAALLGRAYGIDPSRVEVIPHGVPDLPLIDPAVAKPGLSLTDEPLLLSFGLLGPGKGYELALAAMPAVIAAVPSVTLRDPGADPPGPAQVRGRGLSALPPGPGPNAEAGLTTSSSSTVSWARPSSAAGSRRPMSW